MRKMNWTVTYSGDEWDEYGMSTPYHSYFVFATSWQDPNYGIASVTALSMDAPLPPTQLFISESGGPAAAFEEAKASLGALGKNHRLIQTIIQNL